MQTLGIISERVFKKAGYILRREVIETQHVTDDPTMEWTMAYTPSGDYIGSQTWAHRLCVTRGIRPEKSKPEHCVCSIGFSALDGKWYGWSHRAISGFKIGSTCNRREEQSWTAKTVADARQMACDFAESVS